ncbi:MAG TPA: hypothetical protein VI142_03400 [Gaiellaceae bacterium]
METEDVVNVLRNIQRSVVPGGRVLDVHPLGLDMAVRAGARGLGFIDTQRFAEVVAAMNEGVAQVESEGLLRHLRSARRHVVERFDDPAEAIEEADSWENLRLPAAVRRRLAEAQERPIEFVDTVRYRLFAV